jgi:S1-C subfamily serine protease
MIHFSQLFACAQKRVRSRANLPARACCNAGGELFPVERFTASQMSDSNVMRSIDCVGGRGRHVRLRARRVRRFLVGCALVAPALLLPSCSQFAPLPPDNHALDAIKVFPEIPSSKTQTVGELAANFKKLTFIVTRQPRRNGFSRENLPTADFGSGVLVFAGRHGYLVLSSRHLIDGPDWRHARPYKGRVAVAPEKGDFTFAKVVGRHRTRDLILLMVKSHRRKSTFAQPVVRYADVLPGERIVVFGHPPGLFFTVSDGVVSRRRGKDLIQITVPASPGMSGGPVYDFHGRLVGIADAAADEQRASGEKRRNLAVCVDSLFEPKDWMLNSRGTRLLNEFRAALPDDAR